MTQVHYTPLEPETDDKLRSNPHYWLYKVTRDALDHPNHPLHSLGHIWNRWACEGLSEEEKEIQHGTFEGSFPLKTHTILLEDDKIKIENHINDEIRHFNIENFNWSFSILPEQINFFHTTTWENKIDFSNFIFNKDFCIWNATFNQGLAFFQAMFRKRVSFTNITCKQDIVFGHASFMGDTTISSIFESNINFQNVKFSNNVMLRCDFEKSVDFWNATFNGDVDFNGTTFRRDAKFENTIFNGNTSFKNTLTHQSEFLGNANFKHSKFKGNADFWGAKFYQNVDFSDSKFTGNIIKFDQCHFLKPTNPDAIFSFKNTVFATKVNFSESEFHHLPNLTGTDFRGGVNLDKVKFPPNFSKTPKSSFPTAEAKPQGKGNLKNSDTKDSLSFSDTSHTSTSSVSSSVTEKTGMTNTDDCPIKGGLEHYKDAAVTWHALSTEMEKAGYHDQSLEYFGYELEAKRLNKPKKENKDKKEKENKNEYTPFSLRFVLLLYKFFSDYGKSIARPFWWWLGLGFLFFPLVYYYYINDFAYSLKFAFKGLLPFVSDQTTFFDRMFIDADAIKQCPIDTSLSHEPIVFNNTLELLIFPFLYGLHTLLSIILIFLFGLGVRNRLRLR